MVVCQEKAYSSLLPPASSKPENSLVGHRPINWENGQPEKCYQWLVEVQKEKKEGSILRAVATTFKELWPLNEPNAYAALIEDTETRGLRYVVIEPTLLDEEKTCLDEIDSVLIEELDADLKTIGEPEKAAAYLRGKIEKIAKTYGMKVTKETLDKFMYYILRDYINYDRIDAMMRDHMVEDISCDGPNVPIYVWHRQYESLPTNVAFDSATELDSFVVRLAYKSGRHISIATPMIDATLPDGSRAQITYGKEVTRRGSTFSIRKFKADPLTITDLIEFKTLTAEMAAFFWFVVENRVCLMVSGGTATGKTTTLNCLSMFIRPDAKIVSIEETAELNLPHENWIASISRPSFGVGRGPAEISLFDLLKAALRQRPDYIIVGEVRGSEAYTLFQAMATGHGGLSSIHADTVEGMINRLETEPMNIPRALVPTLDMVAVMTRTRIGGMPVRRIELASEIANLKGNTGEISVRNVFKWDPATDLFSSTGKSGLIEKIKLRKGITQDVVDTELTRRQTILEWMVKSKIRRYKDVAGIIRDYSNDPAGAFDRARLGLLH